MSIVGLHSYFFVFCKYNWVVTASDGCLNTEFNMPYNYLSFIIRDISNILSYDVSPIDKLCCA